MATAMLSERARRGQRALASGKITAAPLCETRSPTLARRSSCESLPYLNGDNLRPLPLIERKIDSGGCSGAGPIILIAEAMAVNARGTALMAAVEGHAFAASSARVDPYRRGVPCWPRA